MIIRTLSHEHLQTGVHGRELRKMVADLLLAHRGGKVILALENEVRRHVGIEIVKRLDSYPAEHAADVFLRMGEITECSHVHVRISLQVCRMRKR